MAHPAIEAMFTSRRFNPNLTQGEYNALSETEKSEWEKRIFDYWTKGTDLDWDYEPSGYQAETNGEFSS